MNRITYPEVVVASAVRTPIGKFRGAYSRVDAYKLGAAVIQEAVNRAGVPAEEIAEVVFGNLVGLPGNIARVCSLAAGIPQTVSAITLDRQCSSGLDAIAYAAAMVRSGKGDIYIAGGTENMTRAPYYMEKPENPYSYFPPSFLQAQLTPPESGTFTMGETAENLASRYKISREEQDLFAGESHRKAAEAYRSGAFKEQILPIEVPEGRNGKILVTEDESVRPDTTPEKLASLRPAFKNDGSVTAGNSCPMNDGAAALVVMSREKAEALNIAWLAEILDWETAGLDPEVMGLGPVYAVKKMQGSGALSLSEIDFIELNEAFAVQVLACVKELGLDKSKLNINGGAIALGHPLGATGAILAVKTAYLLKENPGSTGLVTLCIGGGQGAALLMRGRKG